MSLVICLVDRAPVHESPAHIEAFELYLGEFSASRLPGPHIYRVFVPATIIFLSTQFNLSALWIDFALKALSLILFQVVFFLYLRRFTGLVESCAGILALLVYIVSALSYSSGPAVFETTDIVNLVVYVAALFALERDKFGWFCAVIFFGMFNRETPLPLALVPFFLDSPLPVRFRRLLVGTVVAAVPYVGLRLIVETTDASWWKMADMIRNVPLLSLDYTAAAIRSNVKLVALVGPFIGLAAIRFKSRPSFLRGTASVVLPFLLLHFALGRISEIRLWLPLLAVLTPLAIGGVEILARQTRGKPG